MTNNAGVTTHAKDRGKERLSWGKETIIRMAKRALTEGMGEDNTSGDLNDYILRVGKCKNQKRVRVRIYAQHVFIFAKKSLVTVFPAPKSIKRILN